MSGSPPVGWGRGCLLIRSSDNPLPRAGEGGGFGRYQTGVVLLLVLLLVLLVLVRLVLLLVVVVLVLLGW